MIIYRAFVRETARNTAAYTLVLIAILAFLGLATLLGQAARGELAPDIVFTLLGLESLRRLDLLLILGFYLGVLLTAARWYRDNEITVLAACGVGLMQLLRPALVLGVVVMCTIAALGFFITPWAFGRMNFVKLEREHRTQVTGIAPGVFNEISGRGRIFYAEHVDSHSGKMGEVFLGSLEKGKNNVVLARTGYTNTDGKTGDRFLTLQNGTLYQGTPGEANYRILNFQNMQIRLLSRPFAEPPPHADAMTNRQLMAQGDGEAYAEWHWRISKPLMAAILMLFALVLAHTDPRRGRLSNLFAAILVFFTYSNALALGQTLIKKGQLPGSVGLWWVHAIVLALAVYLFSRRVAHRPLLEWPQKKARRSSPDRGPDRASEKR